MNFVWQDPLLTLANLWPADIAWIPRLYWSLFQVAVEVELGALILFLIHSFTGGDWGERLKPAFQAIMRLMPILLLAFCPMIFCLSAVFPWAQTANREVVSQLVLSPQLFRAICLTPLSFVVRSLSYLALWSYFSRRLSAVRAPQATRFVRALMLLALLYSTTFAGMDWVMTIDPDWVSTGFGVIYIIASICSGLALAILLTLERPAARYANQYSGQSTSPQLFIDWGNLFLMSTLLWIYMNFMQYIVIWSAQDPSETHWYAVRSHGGWSFVITVVLLLHFFIPFPILLSRWLKTRPLTLQIIASFFLFSQILEVLLWVMP